MSKNKRKNTDAIRIELAILVKSKQKDCATDKQRNIALNEARKEINIKYGKNWRVQDIKYNDFPSIYDDHQFGEHWMD